MRLTIKQRNDELSKTFIDGVSVDYLTADLNASRVMNKLGQLEDIEEELGIDLITLFKALKNGIWAKYKTQHNEEQVIYLGMIPVRFRYYPTISLKNREFAFECDKQYWKLKDYGKTWALTKEELENE